MESRCKSARLSQVDREGDGKARWEILEGRKELNDAWRMKMDGTSMDEIRMGVHLRPGPSA